jgi:hypothetical protein
MAEFGGREIFRFFWNFTTEFTVDKQKNSKTKVEKAKGVKG